MEQNKKVRKSFLYMWSSVFIKMGIAYGVYFFFEVLFTTIWIMRETHADVDAMMEIYNSQAAIQQANAIVAAQVSEYTVLIEGLAALITIPIIFWMFYKDSKLEVQAGMVTKKEPVWKYAAIVLIAGAMGLGLNNLIMLSNLSALSETYTTTMETLYQPSFLIQILVLGILMPICEELVYRGMVFKRFRYQLGFGMAAAYSALIFAITHGNLVQILYGFLMGMLFCLLYEKYGSLWAPIVAHVVANVLSVIGTEYQWFEWIFADPIRVGIITVACAAIASSVYLWIKQIENDRNYDIFQHL